MKDHFQWCPETLKYRRGDKDYTSDSCTISTSYLLGLFCFEAAPIDTQELLLALCPEITTSGVLGTIFDARDELWLAASKKAPYPLY